MTTAAGPTGPPVAPSLETLRAQRDLTDTVVFVSGAGSGIGRATARVCAALGARVVATDRDQDAVQATADGIADEGASCVGWALDVTDVEAIERVVARVRAEVGAIDVLVNNAGVSLPSPVTNSSSVDEGFDHAWSLTFDINLHAHTRLVRACLPDLERRDGDGRCRGRIINVASTEGLGATPGLSAYTASKHAVIGFTKALAVELGARGVTANAVCPGPVDTGMTAAIPEAARAKYLRRRVPMVRYAQPEELAQVIASIALPASSFLNGATVVVDGGLTVKNA